MTTDIPREDDHIINDRYSIQENPIQSYELDEQSSNLLIYHVDAMYLVIADYVRTKNPELCAAIRYQFGIVADISGWNDIERVLLNIYELTSSDLEQRALSDKDVDIDMDMDTCRWVVQHLCHYAYKVNRRSVRSLPLLDVMYRRDAGSGGRVWDWVLHHCVRFSQPRPARRSNKKTPCADSNTPVAVATCHHTIGPAR